MRRFARGETLKTYSIASSLHSAASLHVSFFALWVCLNEHIGGTLRAGGPEATVSTGSWKFDFFADSSSLIGSSSVDSFITKVDVVLVVDVVEVLVVVVVVVGSVVVVGVVLISWK